MAKHFTLPATLDHLKAQYRDLVKRWHPDICQHVNATEIMQEINAEYESLTRAAYKSAAGESYDVNVEDAHVNIMQKVNEIITLVGIEIEICGTWIWVGGNTYPVRDEMNKAGFKFSGPKKKWYYAMDLKTSKKRGTMNMDQIRAKHGSRVIASKGIPVIG